jgi:hypothetical protein
MAIRDARNEMDLNGSVKRTREGDDGPYTYASTLSWLEKTTAT